MAQRPRLKKECKADSAPQPVYVLIHAWMIYKVRLPCLIDLLGCLNLLACHGHRDSFSGVIGVVKKRVEERGMRTEGF